MNERIEKLAKQSGISILYEYDGYDGHAAVANLADIEKFAELIVRECVDRIKNADMTDLEGSDPDDVLWLVERQIQTHFGVEE